MKKIHFKHIIISTIAIIMLIMSTAKNGYPISTSLKAKKDYRLTLEALRKMDPIIKNFNIEYNRKQYDIIRDKFQAASEKFYGRQFSDSAKMFKDLKKSMILLLNKISHEYLIRNKEILDSTAKKSFGIIIDFSKYNTFATYFRKAYNPLKDKMPYTILKKKNEADKHGNTSDASALKNKDYGPEDYHFFQDKETIERYLNRGYRMYQFSKELYDNYDINMIIKKIKNNEKLNDYSLNYAIKNYLDVVKYCRMSNQYGIEIYKIHNLHMYEKNMRKRNLTLGTMSDIYDDRIPDKYKADAIDNKSLFYNIEKRKLSSEEEKSITEAETKRLQSLEEKRKKELEEKEKEKSSDE